MALEGLGEEITQKLKGRVSSVFAQLSYGYTVTSLYSGFVREWVHGDMEEYPQIFSCTIPKGNKIYDDYKKNLQIDNIDQYHVKLNKYSRHLFTDESYLLEETLKAVRDTRGSIISVNEGLLKESANILRRKEDILLSTEEAYPFAGFYKMAKEGKISKGKHVIILNDAASNIEIQEIKDYSKYSLKDLADIVEEWLVEFGDPRGEIEDAVKNAIEKGYFFLAYRNGSPQGVCVLVNINVDVFLATYHMAYIGTKVGNKGRGIATKLIEKAVEASDGKLSLHVDMDNARARKLYEKAGFKTKYYRMDYIED
jgi:threonine synthase